MRGITVDWVIEIHNKLALSPQTLFITVNLLDRYLDKVQIDKSKLQLVASSCMLIASKYEDINPPVVNDFVYFCDNSYSREEFLNMEMSILNTLEFAISMASSYRFLERFSQIAGVSQLIWNYARYLIELALLECRMVAYAPDLMAASALHLSMSII